jgi:hypothetical protein
MNFDDISKCHMSDPKDLRQTERKSAVKSKRLEFPVGECRMIHVEANFRPACGYRLHTSTASTCPQVSKPSEEIQWIPHVSGLTQGHPLVPRPMHMSQNLGGVSFWFKTFVLSWKAEPGRGCAKLLIRPWKNLVDALCWAMQHYAAMVQLWCRPNLKFFMFFKCWCSSQGTKILAQTSRHLSSPQECLPRTEDAKPLSTKYKP